MTVAPERPTHVVRADHVPGPPQGEWTYDDYAALPDDGLKYEIVEGVLFVSAAPSPAHQNAVGWFTYFLRDRIQVPGLGTVYNSPIDVELAVGDVVQPDVIVILAARAAAIGEKKVVGPPDLVIEVASPSTSTFDRRKKLDAYARARVPEVWLPDPFAQTIEVLRLDGDHYVTVGVFSGEDRLPAGVLPQLDIAVARFFA